jgi:hypothetical protein
MTYDRLTASLANDVAAKLLGSYEEELHSALERVVATSPKTFVDVGCAEGYHAVGAALALPEASVRAYDNDEIARRLCARLADANAVAGRVEVRSSFDVGSIAALQRPVVLFMDCEGCEAMLLSAEAKETLSDCTLIVELHEFAVPGIEEGLLDMYAGSHATEIIRAAGRYRALYDELQQVGRLSDVETDLLVMERRPTPMAWAVMLPKTSPT